MTLELPQPLAKSARAVATRTSRPVEEVLVEWFDRAAADLPVELLPDEQVLVQVETALRTEPYFFY